jgi:hypothetical protein
MRLSLIAALSQLLPRDEREAVLGDLTEANESPRQIMLGLLGLVVRRQIALWQNWQPWLAAFGLALPGCFLLMGASFSVVSTLQRTHWGVTAEPDTARNLMTGVFLLIAWSWTAGLAASCLSRRTLWASGVAALVPGLHCLARFQDESLSRFSLFLFVLPAVLGVWQGINHPRIGRRLATVAAAMVTGLTIFGRSEGFSWFDAALLWPVWYVVTTISGNAVDPENRRTT